jgi:Rrf2 family protein
LRAIVYLAGQDEPRTTAQMAEVTQVPAGYLAKVMQQLGRAGLVRSQRGLGGGFTLAREPDNLTVLEVINAVDPLRRFPECPLGIPSHGRRLCPLHFRLDQAAKLVEDALCETKVADLLDTTSRPRSHCHFPAEPERIS